MVRRYEESIEVRAGEGAVGFQLATVSRDSATVTRDMATVSSETVSSEPVSSDQVMRSPEVSAGGQVQGPSPSAFLWRGRLYIVREVIGHWRERRAWWRDALDPDEEVALAQSKVCLEQEVWRVEASPGRLAGTGVYDLAMSGRTWRLLRVAD